MLPDASGGNVGKAGDERGEGPPVASPARPVSMSALLLRAAGQRSAAIVAELLSLGAHPDGPAAAGEAETGADAADMAGASDGGAGEGEGEEAEAETAARANGDGAAAAAAAPVARRWPPSAPPKRLRNDRPPSPLYAAAAAGDAASLRLLLAAGANVRLPCVRGAMAAHAAARAADGGECLALLLKAGAPLMAKDGNKQTILHHAARAGSEGAMAAALHHWACGARAYDSKKGGTYDWRDRWHRTAVHWAVLNGHTAVVRQLAAAGAALAPTVLHASAQRRSTSLQYETPLQIARRAQPHNAQLIALLEAALEAASIAEGDAPS